MKGRRERQRAAEALDPDLKRQRQEKEREQTRQGKKRFLERQRAAEALDPDLKRQRQEKRRLLALPSRPKSTPRCPAKQVAGQESAQALWASRCHCHAAARTSGWWMCPVP